MPAGVLCDVCGCAVRLVRLDGAANLRDECNFLADLSFACR